MTIKSNIQVDLLLELERQLIAVKRQTQSEQQNKRPNEQAMRCI